MNKKDLFRTLLTVCLSLLVASGAVFAAGKSNGYGLLTAIEDDGTVIIKDGKGQLNGYLLSRSVTVQESDGTRILLKSLLPSRYIYFEYEYTQNGFVITLIKAIPR